MPGSELLVTGVRPVLRYSEISSPKPRKMFVFVDENEFSVDDGDFATALVGGPHDGQWWNYPASRHSNGTTLSFADGHAEYWLRTTLGVSRLAHHRLRIDRRKNP